MVGRSAPFGERSLMSTDPFRLTREESMNSSDTSDPPTRRRVGSLGCWSREDPQTHVDSRPRRGYWARVAAGQRLKRTPVPRVPNGDEHTLVVHASPLAHRKDVNLPVVPVADRLSEPHEAVGWVNQFAREGSEGRARSPCRWRSARKFPSASGRLAETEHCASLTLCSKLLQLVATR